MERLETGLERPLGYLCKAAVSYGLLLRTVERISDLEPQKTHAAQLRHVNQKLVDETNAEDRRLLHEKQKYENKFATSLRASAEELARGFELAAQRNEAAALARQLKSASAATEKQVQELSMEISKLHRENKVRALVDAL
ncbi:hypothetical protein HDU89_003230 [Geranomyces variabilis]|nr:hypothetical protein HDU89_003230 [Geranomyces variabilis]